MTAFRAATGTAYPAPKMNYIEIINRFWQLDAELKFAPNATRLYFFLVAECNRQRWKNPFVLADAYLCMGLKMPKNTMKPARAELLERGVIAHQGGGNGAGDASVYALQFNEQVAPLKVSKSDSLPSDKVSDFDPLSENKGSGMVSESDTLIPNKGSDKVSDFDPTIYKEENKTSSVVKQEEVEPASSALASVEKVITSQPASQKAEPQTDGARRPSAHADDAQLTSADVTPLLNNPAVFKAACLDINPAYAGIDFEHYRLDMRFDSIEKELKLMPFEWRKRLRYWLSNAKNSRNGLLLAPVPGQTKGDPRAIQPLAARSSASPTKKNSWS